MASTRVNQVLTGIKKLTSSEREELIKLLSSGSITEEKKKEQAVILEKSLLQANSIHTAPVGTGGCACCGK